MFLHGGCPDTARPESQPQFGKLPDYLADVDLKVYDPSTAAPDPDIARLGTDEPIEIIGRMGSLMGGPETIFTLHTPHGSKFDCLATREKTSGYGAIAVEQYARIKAVRYTNQVSSHFVQHGMVNTPQLLVLEYTMLVDPDRVD